MPRNLTLAAVLIAVFLIHPASAQPIAARPRGVYASINMDVPAQMIQRLRASYGTDKRVAIHEVQGRPGAYMPPVLYALANALADPTEFTWTRLRKGLRLRPLGQAFQG